VVDGFEVTDAERDAVAAMRGADYALQPERECDMVMKGGITSGVVYPLTVCKLATRYRLRSIGGTSAGAIAAVLAAAAEHRRQRPDRPSTDGFRRLAELPAELAVRLERLFQPQAATRELFAVLHAGLAPEASRPGRVAAVARAAVRARWGWFLTGLAVALVVVGPGLTIVAGLPLDGGSWWRVAAGLLLPLLAGATLGVVLALLSLALTAGRTLPDVGFGLTSGMGESAGDPALTAWLTDVIDEVAGVDDPTGCLTTGDLWGAPAVASWREATARGFVGQPPEWQLRAQRRIDLEVMTTNLTTRRPMRLPAQDQTLLFDRTEFEALFPERVVATMATMTSNHLHPDTGAALHYFPGPGTTTDGRPRPGPFELPVVVVARLSLSFPVLISAVPLYTVDRTDGNRVVRVWFSDGGIGSNFPIHFFDRLLPTRPTFGIDLRPVRPSDPDRLVWRASPTGANLQPRVRSFTGLQGFLAAILDTMQNWADTSQTTLRGYADRVVEIRLRPGEGGMNLRMREALITSLAARGAAAGDALLDFEWDAHRLIRYRIAMSRLTEALGPLAAAWRKGTDVGTYANLVAGYPSDGVANSYLGSKAWRDRDAAATHALVEVVDRWDRDAWPALTAPAPRPAPELRLAPR
jgi:predicted acylesterase/phospholipase RssA